MTILPSFLQKPFEKSSSRTKNQFLRASIAAGFLILIESTTGCNAFSFADSPSGDTELLSAARACFDQGNYTCASSYYSKLSSSDSDLATSEEVFLTLQQYGAGSSVFINAISSGATTAGQLITKISNSIGSSSNANQTSRLAYFHAYQKYTSISNTQTQGLVQFVTSLTLIAELLAEAAGTAGNLKQSDLVTNPTTCGAATLAQAVLYSSGLGCGAPTSLLWTGSSSIGTLINASDSQLSGSANLYMLNSAVIALSQGLTNMQVTSSLGSSASTFTAEISLGAATLVAGTDSPGYRYILINQGVGGS